ncbi:hypothetical protein ASD45_14480 [Pseudolabrys sp. Root1462]|nr:hypothetical protein ASD45_14480 [Pseudolabrys sp. Root1462]
MADLPDAQEVDLRGRNRYGKFMPIWAGVGSRELASKLFDFVRKGGIQNRRHRKTVLPRIASGTYLSGFGLWARAGLGISPVGL